MENRHLTAFVAIDLSAAFDTVDHTVLFSVLQKRFGLCVDIVDWVRSYLTPRKMFVNVLGHKSQVKDLNFSVPQGSCLGPVLFNYYTSTLPLSIEDLNLDLSGYADDHGVYTSFVPNAQAEFQALDRVERVLLSINEWMNSNRLKMNPSKTEFIVFGTPQQLAKAQCDSINVCGTNVKRARKIKSLGVWFDDSVSMKDHISDKIRIAMCNLINIRTIRPFLSIKACKTVVQNLVLNHLDYCNSLLFNLPECEIKRLQWVQNAAAKLVLGVSRYHSSRDALKKLHWLPIRARIDFKIAVLVFQCLHNDAPSYLQDLLTVKSSGRSLRSTGQDSAPTLDIPLHRHSTLLDRSFAFSGPTVWNSIPANIRKIKNITSFRNHLKTHMCDIWFT